MPKMVCAQCQRELTPIKNGVYVFEMMGPNDRPSVYKIWQADLWGCKLCDARVVAGFASNPLAEHHATGFDAALKLILHGHANWVLYDYENQEQREAGGKMGYKNIYGTGPELTPDEGRLLDRLLAR